MSAPAVFAIPAELSFAACLATGLFARFADAPEDLGRALLLANTRRSHKLIEEALLRAAGGAALLPRVTILS